MGAAAAVGLAGLGRAVASARSQSPSASLRAPARSEAELSGSSAPTNCSPLHSKPPYPPASGLGPRFCVRLPRFGGGVEGLRCGLPGLLREAENECWFTWTQKPHSSQGRFYSERASTPNTAVHLQRHNSGRPAGGTAVNLALDRGHGGGGLLLLGASH
jgi:hypothetical protein